MKWENTCFSMQEVAKQCKAALESAGIKTDEIIIVDWNGLDSRYFVPWLAVGCEQQKTALEIVCTYLD